MGGAAGALGLIRDRLSPSKGRNDYWIVVLNESGDVTSDFSFGGQNKEAAQSFSSSPCGGGIIGGISDSPVSGDVSQPRRVSEDRWVVRFDNQGNKI